jgi:hypothetical protein
MSLDYAAAEFSPYCADFSFNNFIASSNSVEFSVDKGRFITYDVISSLVATGATTANKIIKYPLSKSVK